MTTQHSKRIFLFLLIGFGLFCEVHSGIFVVYPFQVGYTNPSKPKVSSRQLDINRKDLNETKLHLVYPVHEELYIMTPSPMEGSAGVLLPTTTESPTTHADELTTTTDFSDTTTEVFDEVELRFDLEEYRTTTEDTSSESTTDIITTETPRITSTGSVSLSIYDTTSPIKFLTKRMPKFPKRYNPSVHTKIYEHMKSLTTKEPLTTARPKYKKGITRHGSTVVRETMTERNSLTALKNSDDGTPTTPRSAASLLNKARRRNMYKRRPSKFRMNKDEIRAESRRTQRGERDSL